MPRYGDDERVIVLNGGRGGVDGVIDKFLTDLLSEALDKHRKKHDHEDENKKKTWRPKPVSKEVVFCWTVLLMAVSPIIGLKMLQFYANLLGEYATVLQHFVK